MNTRLPRWVWVGAITLAGIAGMVNAVGFLGFEHLAVPASDPPILPCRPSPCPAGRDGSPLSGVRPRPVRHPRPFRTSHQEPTMTRGKRIYVLDTNVLMHDPTALFKFEEHDIYLPMQVIEELDNAKKGTSEASRKRPGQCWNRPRPGHARRTAWPARSCRRRR